MFDWINSVMSNGYVDEHGHKLYGAAAIAHIGNLPISAIDQHTIEAGKKIVEKLLRAQ